MAGRKATPTAIRVVQGTTGYVKKNPNEPQPDLLEAKRAVEARDRFLTSAEAKAIWDFHYPALRAAQLITEIDVMAFVRWCEAEAECWRTQQIVSDLLAAGQMPILRSEKGGFNYHPAVVLRNRAAERAAKGATEFGMTPAARTRIRVEAQLDLFGENNPVAKLLSELHGKGANNLPANAAA
jgi:P27 family predicted phage terminase small subunit